LVPNSSDNQADKVFREARELFLDTLKMDPWERELFLALAAAGDPGLRARVRDLWCAEDGFSGAEERAPDEGRVALVGSLFRYLRAYGYR
jgi:hypothetical protein